MQVSDFIQAIRSGCEPVSGGMLGRDVVKILEAAEESAKSLGAPVYL